MESICWLRVFTTASYLVLMSFPLSHAISERAAAMQEAHNDTSLCPKPCQTAGYSPTNWTTFPSLDWLPGCKTDPVLISYILDAAGKPSTVKACSSTFSEDFIMTRDLDLPVEHENELTSETVNRNVFCRSEDGYPGAIERTINVEHSAIKSRKPVEANFDQAALATRLMQSTLLFHSMDNESTLLQTHYGNSTIGIWIRPEVDKKVFAISTLTQFIEEVRKGNEFGTLQLQHCDQSQEPIATFGIIAETSSEGQSSAAIQDTLKTWAAGKCAKSLGNVRLEQNYIRQLEPNQAIGTQSNLTLGHLPFPSSIRNSTSSSVRESLNTSSREAVVNRISVAPQATCEWNRIQQGEDSCEKLANKCRVSPHDFMVYNSELGFCANLRERGPYCCSAGSKPDLKPKQNGDGTCQVYTVQQGDWCAKIAAEFDISVAELDRFNRENWGWGGCNQLFPDMKLCLSNGDPPFPEPMSNAVCGPQKPGSKKPPGSKSYEWVHLNPCPLRACCNVWGQCGTTSEFCIPRPLGPPGTSEKGMNGCISNCGSSVVNFDKAPAQFISVGYFEAWNTDRKCLRMDYDQIPFQSYSHIHFAFAEITPTFQVSVSKVADQFQKFVRHRGSKRILAFGGWAFSTEVDTYSIFRNGAKPQNRERLAENLAAFIRDHNLDGIDLDWEYPGEQDMKWIPAASLNEGAEYLELLRALRRRLPDKSLSFAAPASFWYLKPFPIDEMAKVVDYIIYMTYDLHGQWDYGNKWAMPACPGGNCLRSHVNFTETYNALSMITKAGVPTMKVIVGVASYGRQFKMTDPGCNGPMCTYVGPNSAARRGRCTDTPDYISFAEIKEIIRTVPGARVVDEAGDLSKTMIYDGNWVAYLDANDKKKRTEIYKNLNFGGTIDWAIDLNDFMPGDSEIPTTGDRRSLTSLRGSGNSPLMAAEMMQTCVQDPTWKSVMCDHPMINDTEMPVELRWRELKADAAWCAAVTNWKNKFAVTATEKEISFPEKVADFLKYKRSFWCDKIDADNFCVAEMCTNDGTGAATQLIMESFQNIHLGFSRMYRGFLEVDAGIQTDLTTFIETFAPKTGPDPAVVLLTTLLSFGVTLIAGPSFNHMIKTTLWATKGARYDDIKDTTFAVLGAGTALINQDYNAKRKQIEKDTGKKLEFALRDAVFEWKEALEAMNTRIFSGSDESIAFLTQTMKDGKFLGGKPEDQSKVAARVRKLLFALLIPQAWRVRSKFPVLVDTGRPCGAPPGPGSLANREESEKGSYCFADKQYLLLSVEGKFQDTCVKTCNEKYCYVSAMKTPPALDAIQTGSVGWGFVTAQDVVTSALRGYMSWGNDASRKPDLADRTYFDKEYAQLYSNNMAAAAGVVFIPVCGWDEIKRNWRNGPPRQPKNSKETYGNYPCNN